MSNPVTNVEVEDVLSSIRRLVSDDKRPSAVVQTEPSYDRLVLTPALRVAETDDGDQNELVQDHGDENPHSEAVLTTIEPQAWSDFGASPDSQPDNVISPKVEDTNSADSSDENFDAAEQPVETSNDQEHVSSTEILTEPLILEVPVEFTQEDKHNEPDEPEETVSEDIPVVELIQVQGEEAFFAKSAASLSAKIAALETVIGKTDEQWEPDDTGDSDYSGTEAPSMNWDTDHDDADSVEDHQANPDADDENNIVFEQTADDILDEDALRDMVSDIVREELQGALGERITRNVRKLVRREIHRALAAQDFE